MSRKPVTSRRADAVRLVAVGLSQTTWIVGRFLTFLLIGRWLGPAGAGVTAGVLAIGSVASFVTGMGLRSGAIYFVPRYRAAGQEALYNGFVRTALRGIVAAAVAVGLGLSAFAGLGVTFGSTRQGPILGAVYGAALAFLGFVVDVIKAEDKPHISLGVSQGLQGALQLALVGLLVIAVASTPEGAVAGFILAAGISALVGAAYVLRNMSGPSDTSDRRYWYRYSLPLIASGGSLLLLVQVPVLIVAAWASDVEAGGFAVTYRIAALPVLMTAVVGGALGPGCVRLARTGDMAAARQRFRSIVLINVTIVVPALVVLALASEQILLLYGPDFVSFRAVIPVLAVGLGVSGMVGPVAFLLTSLGRKWDVVISYAVISVTALVVCVPASSAGGAQGAAWVIAVGMSTQGLVQLALLYRAAKTGFDDRDLSIETLAT